MSTPPLGIVARRRTPVSPSPAARFPLSISPHIIIDLTTSDDDEELLFQFSDAKMWRVGSDTPSLYRASLMAAKNEMSRVHRDFNPKLGICVITVSSKFTGCSRSATII